MEIRGQLDDPGIPGKCLLAMCVWQESSSASRNQLGCEAQRGTWYRYQYEYRPLLLTEVRTACFCCNAG